MGEKSVQKKRYIVEKAREVFVEKGFKKVTMKDIVEACDISRGGLYLYFENTSQIFMEVLRMESEEADDVFSDSITEDATAADILLLFLKEQCGFLCRTRNRAARYAVRKRIIPHFRRVEFSQRRVGRFTGGF